MEQDWEAESRGNRDDTKGMGSWPYPGYGPRMSRRMTFDEFVIKARVARGDRFEYREDGWRGIAGKVLVICPDHGEWLANAGWHLKGVDCPRCVRPGSNMSFGEAVVRAVAVHGDRYRYIDDSWNGASGMLTYECEVHGRVQQVFGDHIKGRGCRKCGYVKTSIALRFTREEFLARAMSVHGDRYDYPDEIPQKNDAMIINCRIHGPFKQKRTEHFAGHGCHTCGGRKRRNTEQYIAEARARHGDRFSYDRTVFVRTTDKLIVTCRVHGDFMVNANMHLLGNGCVDCAGLRRRTTEQFVEKAKERFGDRYDYSLVEYVNSNEEVTIICPSHGPFEQRPVYHLVNAVGCPKCTYSVSRPETEWLDDLGIGQSIRQARIRLKGKSRSVDAYDPDTNTVYEFWGSWWHGDPKVFPPDGIHSVAKKTYGELYRRTMEKRGLIIAAGYRLVEVWESEYVGLKDQRGISDPAGPVQMVLF